MQLVLGNISTLRCTKNFTAKCLTSTLLYRALCLSQRNSKSCASRITFSDLSFLCLNYVDQSCRIFLWRLFLTIPSAKPQPEDKLFPMCLNLSFIPNLTGIGRLTQDQLSVFFLLHHSPYIYVNNLKNAENPAAPVKPDNFAFLHFFFAVIYVFIHEPV